jgi:uncharacterized membrane protein YfcA
MMGVIGAGVFAGLALGMLGAGGTIIGLPMLLYLGDLQGHAAFGTNAFGVSVIAFLLLLWRLHKQEVNVLLGITFAVPGLFGIAIGTRLGLLYPAAKLIFLLSFLILIVAGWIGYLGIRTSSTADADQVATTTTVITDRQVLRIVPTAFLVGVISGFFAIGGGFLVVPGLAFAAAVNLRVSARSSLLPITAFAAFDAIDYLIAGQVQFAAGGIMIVAGIAGGAMGIFLHNRLSLPVVQKIFAVSLALVAAYMIVQNW